MRLRSSVIVLFVCATAIGCTHSGAPRPVTSTPPSRVTPPAARPSLVPWPATVELGSQRVSITKDMAIEVSPGQADLQRIARGLADLVRPALETSPIVRDVGPSPVSGTIRLEVDASRAAQGNEAYDLTIAADGIRIVSGTAAGVFYGVQTLRQLLPASVELRGARPHALTVPAGHIADRPRYAWRGAMLDVGRHFFGVRDVKRYLDLLAFYKFNRLHLHLSDDQGWRIEIASWPLLTTKGGSTAVGGGPGGFYTKDDYAEIVTYARERFITIIPEIDMPTHINAALASYPELNCDGAAPPLYTGIEVGFSSFCVDKDITYRFIDDVVREIAAMTPGPYFHIGGDEVKKLTPAQYKAFIERVQGIVQARGKQVIGWDEVTKASLLPTTIVQYWRPDASIAPPSGTKLILSPANKIYLDMKYDDASVLGLNWAGNVDVPVAYQWNPATLLPKVPESDILGVESPIWSETLANMSDVEFMAFPRLAVVSEVAWSAESGRQWDEFRVRLGAQALRWSALGINAYWSPRVDWQR
jgi:hexosaminidase